MAKISTVAMDATTEKEATEAQRIQLRKIKKLLTSLSVDKAMIDAIDQAIVDNEMW